VRGLTGENYAIIMACEDAVMATNDDAAQCKRFAVEKGYWQDPYITLLVPKGRAGHAPEINKGYYARVTSIRVLIQKFLQVILPLRCLLEILYLLTSFYY